MMAITAIDRGQVLAVLEREEGVGLPWATIDVIVDALGWTAKSARATLAALVRGGEVERSWRDGEEMFRALPRLRPDVAPLDVRVEEQPSRVGDEDSYIGSLSINGVPHHITLLRVFREGDGQDAGPGHAARFRAIQDFEDEAPGFMPLRIGEGDYLCVVTPYSL